MVKKITKLLFLFSLISTVAFSQTTETFETETAGSTTLTFNGKKDGVVTPVFTVVKNSGIIDGANFTPNNGFTFVNFALEGEEEDNSNKPIDELVISSTNTGDYLALDAFTWDTTVIAPTAPTVFTTNASAISSTSATLKGSVTSDGGAPVTERGIVYSTTDTTPTIAEGASKEMIGSGTGVFSKSFTGLAPGTVYYYSAYAINSVGTSYGDAISFTTTSIAPTVFTTNASAISSTSATLKGSVTSDGGAPVTERGIVYSTTDTTPTIAEGASKEMIGSGTGVFSKSFTGLAPGTVYYYSAYAINSVGTSYGDAISFTTTSIAPTVFTTNASAISSTSATLKGNVTSDGGAPVTERGIVYSTTDTTPTIAEGASKEMIGSGTGVFSKSFTGLAPGTVYYYSAYAINSVGTSYGDAISFTTTSIAPTVFTTNASAISSTSATLKGNVTSDGGAPVTERGIVYSTTDTTPTIAEGASKEMIGSGTGVFSKSFTGLAPGTVYYYSAYAINSVGTSYGDAISFTTTSIAPTVFTTNASAISSTSATLKGNVTSDGGAPVTERGIVYSTTDTTPTIAEGASKEMIGSGTGVFSKSFTGLAPGTVYYYSAYAINSVGTSYGDAISFTTTSIAPTVFTTNASAISSTSATLKGNVTSDGGAPVTERGIVYSTTDTTPTIAEGASKEMIGSGTGVFSKSFTGLAPGTVYYYSAYAINSVGTSYGDATSFTTTGKGWTGASANWGTAANWSGNTLPTATDDVIIPNTGVQPIIANGTNALAKDITIDSGASLTIAAGASLTMDGNLVQNGTFTINSDATTNGSFIVKGTATGNVTYSRYLTSSVSALDGWHLVSAPVNGQSINDFSASFLTSTTTNNKSIAIYDNSVESASRWNYYTTSEGTNDIASSGNFLTAKGYYLKKATAGTLDFTGTLNTNDDEAISITDGGDDPNGNRWNLIGNPYTAAIHGNTAADATNNFLKVNIDAGTLDPDRAGIYLWDGGPNYIAKSLDDAAFYIAPGQGFFVYAPVPLLDIGATFVSFTEAMQTHQTGDVFLKSNTNYPEIILNVSDNTKNASTKIRYIQNRTTGLDIGSDIGTFDGDGATNFAVYSHLITESTGVNFAIQALPNSDYENMVVPLGIHAEMGKEITFSLNASNFSPDLKIFLEDRVTNTFTRLDEANSNYKIALTENLNDIGRFYIHTSSSALSVDDGAFLENVNIYKRDHSTLTITGLSAENISVKLFTVLGKQVMRASFKSNGVSDISLPKLASGVYIVQLQTDFGYLNKKIIIE